MAPMGTCLDEDGHVTDATIAYYRRRAEGGVGTITVEGVPRLGRDAGPEPKISGPEYLPGLKRLVEALRPYDITIGIQLMHPGRQVVAGPDRRALARAAELARADPARAHRPRDRADRRGLRQGRRTGARGRLRLRRGPRRARLPAVELPLAARQPARGRLRRQRSRTARASASRSRGRSSPPSAGMPLVWRINGDDGMPGGFDDRRRVEVSQRLEEAGVAAISVSAGTWHTLHVTLAPMFVPRGHMVQLRGRGQAAVTCRSSPSGGSTTPSSPRRSSPTATPTSCCSAAR